MNTKRRAPFCGNCFKEAFVPFVCLNTELAVAVNETGSCGDLRFLIYIQI